MKLYSSDNYYITSDLNIPPKSPIDYPILHGRLKLD